MSSAIVYAALFFALCSGATAVAFALARKKLQDTNQDLQGKIISLEAKGASIRSETRNVVEQKKAKRPEDSNLSEELLDLRKENSRQKDDLKKSREELRSREKELKDSKESVEGALYSLKEENRKLIEQLKEFDNRQSSKSVQSNEALERMKISFDQSRRENQVLKEKIQESERNHGKESEKIGNLLQKLNAAQEKQRNSDLELRKWRDAAKISNGKVLDAHLFLRWHERAEAGRKMYRMMKQLRELSDQKLMTYQEGVTALSEHILKELKIPVPTLTSREVRADKLLGAAWGALVERNLAKTSQELPDSASTSHLPATENSLHSQGT
jgi:hypothetical protein